MILLLGLTDSPISFLICCMMSRWWPIWSHSVALKLMLLLSELTDRYEVGCTDRTTSIYSSLLAFCSEVSFCSWFLVDYPKLSKPLTISFCFLSRKFLNFCRDSSLSKNVYHLTFDCADNVFFCVRFLQVRYSARLYVQPKLLLVYHLDLPGTLFVRNRWAKLRKLILFFVIGHRKVRRIWPRGFSDPLDFWTKN